MRHTNSPAISWQPVFVVGAPRSGTTVLHATICSAPEVNDYVAECAYFSHFLRPLAYLWKQFDVHGRSYFRDREELLQYHSAIITTVLHDTWEHLGRPQVLALKDPLLTPQLPLLSLLVPQARFVTSVRDPRAVVASRMAVLKRQGGDATSTSAARGVCAEYNRDYRTVLELRKQAPARHLLVSYRQLVQGHSFDMLTRFLAIRPNTARMWEGWSANDASRRDPTFSERYGRPLSEQSMNRWQGQLTDAQVQVVTELCGPLAAAMGIPLAAT